MGNGGHRKKGRRREEKGRGGEREEGGGREKVNRGVKGRKAVVIESGSGGEVLALVVVFLMFFF